jgi:glyoxalase family protein
MAVSSGIHHITAITGKPQDNLDFYEGFLGQKLVKQTINFDDPSAYHFYFADATGSPGTVLTFFYWENVPAGTSGSGEVSSIAYEIPEGSVDFWKERAYEFNVSFIEKTNHLDEPILSLTDPDGLTIELVPVEETAPVTVWKGGDVLPQHALRGFRGVMLSVINPQSMLPVLNESLGYEITEQDDTFVRFSAMGERGTLVDIKEVPNARSARQGVGSVHHVAFRAVDAAAQQEIRNQLIEAGLEPTPVIDRHYFQSVYAMTPGGVLFEVATDGPGFTFDEEMDEFGETLQVPGEFLHRKEEIEQMLPSITLPRNRS